MILEKESVRANPSPLVARLLINSPLSQSNSSLLKFLRSPSIAHPLFFELGSISRATTRMPFFLNDGISRPIRVLFPAPVTPVTPMTQVSELSICISIVGYLGHRRHGR